MDVLAAVLDTNNLGDPMIEAMIVEQLQRKRKYQKRCLVLSKFDRLGTARVDAYLKTISTAPKAAAEGTAGRDWFLLHARNSPALRTLIAKEKIAVFPIWTDAFPVPPVPVALPHGYGLTALIVWSLAL